MSDGDGLTGERLARFEAALADYLRELDGGGRPDRERYLAAHPDLAAELGATFDAHDRMGGLVGKPLGPTDSDITLPPGYLLGAYQIEDVIGVGGMGTVYRARHRDLDRTVAIKVLTDKLSRDVQFIDRFKREARALAQLEHPNIVRIHDLSVQHDVYYFVMEYVEGVNLRRLMETGEVSPERALALVPQICQALEFAHDHGIVHRDIKPENILVDLEGTPKIADFGLAKIVGGAHPGTMTQSGVLMGTFNYMAPEQTRSSAVDHRADIYALGVVLYEMLTGTLPVGHFEMPSKKIQVDVRIDEVVARALENEPDRRYQHASHMGRDVTQVTSSPKAPGRDKQRRVEVTKTETGVSLGGGEVSWLRVVAASEEKLKVVGWGRDEVGVTLEDDDSVVVSLIDPAGRPWIGSKTEIPEEGLGLSLELPEEEVTVHVPKGLDVKVQCPTAEVEVMGLAADLCLEPGKGNAFVSSHGGDLVADRIEDGQLLVFGMRGSAVDVRSQTGRVILSNLRLDGGRGSIDTQEGAVYLGGTPQGNDYKVEIETAFGEIRDGLGVVDRAEDNRGVGVLGQGNGLLVVRSHSGNVHLKPKAKLIQAVYTQMVQNEIGCIVAAIPAIAFVLWMGWPWATGIITVFAALSVWQALETWQKHFRGRD